MWLTVLPLDMLLTWYHIKHFATVLIIPTFYFCIQLTGLVSVSQFFDLGLTRRVWSRTRTWSRPHTFWSRSRSFWSRSHKTCLVSASVLVSASHSLVSVSQFLVSVLQDVFGLGFGLGLGLTLSGFGLTVLGLGLTRRVWSRPRSWSWPHTLWSRSHSFWSRSYKTCLVSVSFSVSLCYGLIYKHVCD